MCSVQLDIICLDVLKVIQGLETAQQLDTMRRMI